VRVSMGGGCRRSVRSGTFTATARSTFEPDEIDWDNVEYDEEAWPIRPASRRFSWLLERPGFVVRHCNMCEDAFVARFEHDAVCPHCGWPNAWTLIAVPKVEDDLRPGERLGLLNKGTGEEIFVVGCTCGELFDDPRWEAGECPSCGLRVPVVAPLPEADQAHWREDPREGR
jgi:hypothetical protein